MCRLVLSGILWCICAGLAYGSRDCPKGTYRDFGSGHCDPCSDICEYMKIKGTEEDCRKNCPDDFRLNFASKSKRDNKVGTKKTTDKEGSILPVVLSVLAAVVVVSVVLALVVYRRVHVSPRHRPIQPAIETLVELPSIQCTEESASDFHEVPIGYKSSQNVFPNPEKITLIEDMDTNPSNGVAIGVSVTVFIISISIVIAVFFLRRRRRSGGPVNTTTPHPPEQEPSLSYVDSSIIAQIEDKSKPLISTGHACEDRPEQDHPVHRPDIPTRVTSVSEV